MSTIALAIVGRTTVSFEVMAQWIVALREAHWEGPTFTVPDIYHSGHWIGVCPLRNLCYYHALNSPKPWDYILSMDADHRVHHYLFQRLQEHVAADRAVVCGPYYSRSYPFEVQAFGEVAAGGVKHVRPTVLVPAFNAMLAGQNPLPHLMRASREIGFKIASGRGAPLIEVAGGGTGCMLIRRDVIERLAAIRGAGNLWHVDAVPWQEQMRLLGEGNFISGVVTEDIQFCADVREQLGETVWLDLDVRMETGHMGEMPVDRRQYLAAHQVSIPEGIDPKQVLPPGYEFVRTE